MPTPHDLLAERSLLGAGLIDNDLIDRAAEIVGPSDFFREGHRRLFDTMVMLRARREPVDLVTLNDELGRSNELEGVGGPAYISALTDGVPRSANVEYYARIVKEKATLRRLAASATIIAKHAEGERLDRALEALRIASDEYREIAEPGGRGLLTDAEVLDDPADVPMLIDGMIAAKTVYGLVGPQGAGKSTVAICKSVAVSAGVPFLGRAIGTRGASVYAALEGRANLKARIAAAKSAAGLSIFEPCGLHVWLDGIDILRPASVDAFLRAAVTVKPVDVLFDTWGQAFTGDENSSQDVGRGLRALQRIQRELDCAVGVVHHTNAAATRERGSTAFRAGLDTMILLIVADDALALTCEKQRDAEPFAEIAIKLTPVPGSGAQVVRLAADVLPATDLTAAQAKALARLVGSFTQGASSSEWRATLPEVPERSFYRITAELVRRGYVLSDGQGRHVRYRPAAGVTATLPTSLPRRLP